MIAVEAPDVSSLRLPDSAFASGREAHGSAVSRCGRVPAFLVSRIVGVRLGFRFTQHASRVVEADMASPHAATSQATQTSPAANTAGHQDSSDARPPAT